MSLGLSMGETPVDVSVNIGRGMAAQFAVSYFSPSRLTMSLSLVSPIPGWRKII